MVRSGSVDWLAVYVNNGRTTKKPLLIYNTTICTRIKTGNSIFKLVAVQCLCLLYQCLNHIHTHTTEQFMYAQAFFGATTIIIPLIRDVHLRIFFNWSTFAIFIGQNFHICVYQTRVLQINLIAICVAFKMSLAQILSSLLTSNISNQEAHSMFMSYFTGTKKTSLSESRTRNDTNNES